MVQLTMAYDRQIDEKTDPREDIDIIPGPLETSSFPSQLQVRQPWDELIAIQRQRIRRLTWAVGICSMIALFAVGCLMIVALTANSTDDDLSLAVAPTLPPNVTTGLRRFNSIFKGGIRMYLFDQDHYQGRSVVIGTRFGQCVTFDPIKPRSALFQHGLCAELFTGKYCRNSSYIAMGSCCDPNSRFQSKSFYEIESNSFRLGDNMSSVMSARPCIPLQ